jgi:hypothetical protein
MGLSTSYNQALDLHIDISVPVDLAAVAVRERIILQPFPGMEITLQASRSETSHYHFLISIPGMNSGRIVARSSCIKWQAAPVRAIVKDQNPGKLKRISLFRIPGNPCSLNPFCLSYFAETQGV